MNRIENLPQSQRRQLYELCWQFEEAWEQDNQVSLADWAVKIDDINPVIVMQELQETLIELEMRSREQQSVASAATDRYEFLEEIARGGAAVIWRVYDRQLQRQSAVKYLMDSQDNREMRSRLRREARICARLVHPGIVPVHELSSFEDGRPFVCMKLIEGKTLLQLLKSSPPIAHEQSLDIFTKACEAMAYAHDKGIVHRDLTPSNIMVGPFGEVQIMDWGLAKDLSGESSYDENVDASDELISVRSKGPPKNRSHGDIEPSTQNIGTEKTRIGTVFGTLAYLSPEQACGKLDQVDKQSDVFALGAILCRILTGAPPYQEQDQDKLLANAQQGQVQPAIQRLGRSRHKLLAEFAVQCLSVSRERRPRDAAAIVQRLEQVLIKTRRYQRLWTYVTATLLAVGLLTIALMRPTSSTAIPLKESDDKKSATEFTELDQIVNLIRSGQPELAMSNYPLALEKHPDDIALHSHICTCLMNQYREADAEPVAKKLIAMDPKCPSNHFMLGESYCKQGRFQEALVEMQNAKEYRDAGTPTGYPIEQRMEKIQRYLQFETRLASLKAADLQAISANDTLEMGWACSYSNRIEFAILLFNKACDEAANEFDRSLLRFQMINEFVRVKLAYGKLSPENRNRIAAAGLDWLQKQVAMVRKYFDKPIASSDTTILPIERELVGELKKGITLRFARLAIDDNRVDSRVREELKQIVQEIEQAR